MADNFITSSEAFYYLTSYFKDTLKTDYSYSAVKALLAENPKALTNIYAEMGVTAVPPGIFNAEAEALGVYERFYLSPSYAVEVGTTSLTSTPTYGLTALQASADVATDTLTMTQLPEVVTESGATLSAGGGVFFSEVLPVLGAVTVGTGLGIAEYKKHPRFWTDLSDAIFGTGNGERNAFEIITRAIEDGGIGSYMRAEDVARITKALNDMNAYPTTKVESTIPKDTPDGTVVDFTWSEVSPIGLASSIALQKFREAGYSNPIYSVQENRYTNPYTGKVGTWGSAESILNPPTSGDIGRYTGEDIYVTGFNISYIGYSVVVYDDGELQYVGYHEGHQSFYSGEYISDEAPLYVHRIHGLNVDITTEGGREEVPKHGVTPTISPNATVDSALQGLRNAFPDWFRAGFTVPKIDPATGDIYDELYIPIGLPTVNPAEKDLPEEDYEQEQAQKSEIDPESETQTQALTVPLPFMVIPNFIKPSSPPTPSVGLPTITAKSNSLFAVYNPTLGEINDLGSYLWSSNIIDIISKFFQNPMDAIISLHMIYGTPHIGSRHTIKLGYLDSGVLSDVVDNQYISIDCGTVAVKESYGDVRDYGGYTTVQAFLPFIGFVTLKTEEIIASYVNISYRIDVLTGTVLCNISVTKQGVTKILYTFSGNCAVQIPLTGSDKTRLMSGAVSGAVKGGAVGGPIGAILGGVVGGFTGGVSIDRSGSFNGNAGAMGVKTPYLVIERKIPYDPAHYNKVYGYPSNETVILGNCNGFTRVKEAHLETLTCTEVEKEEITNLLLSGVYL